MMKERAEKRCKKSGFLQKTFNILENEEYKHIISWHENGAGFIIHDCEQFTSKVLPKYFRHEKFNSFVRQLNMYGFTKKRAPRSQNYYSHEKFKKDSREAIREIQRRTEKKNGNRKQRRQERVQSELSIELESRYEHPGKEKDSEHDKLYFNLYSLLNANQQILSSQSAIIDEISRDLRMLELSGHQVKKPILPYFDDYIALNSSFNAHLLDKARNEIKGSQKIVKSIAVVQTQANINNERKALELFTPKE